MPAQEPGTLAGKLVPAVDRIRHIAARLGVRVYRVFLVHAYWTGSRRGDGDIVEVSRREILPVPRVRDLNAVRRNIHATGLVEEGDVIVDRISAKYAEDDLVGKTPDLKDPELPRTTLRNMEFWYEIVENRPAIPDPVRRRFSAPVAAPMLNRGGLQWTIVLTKQGEDRARRSDP